MVFSPVAMGCIQSKLVDRSKKAALNRNAAKINVVGRQAPYENDTNTVASDIGTTINLSMRSPRTNVSNSVVSNGNPGTNRVQPTEDHEPASSLPDTMTIYSMDGKQSPISNVTIKPKESAFSRGKQSSRGSTELYLEELDTDMDEFSRIRPDPRYIHRPGDRFNPATTDILLPRRKETPYPEEQSTDKPRKKSNRSSARAMTLAKHESRETSNVKNNSNGASTISLKKNSKKKRKDKLNNKKKKNQTSEHSNADSDIMFNSIEGTIKMDDMNKVNQLLNENQFPTENVETNTPKSTKNLYKTTQPIKGSANNKDELPYVFRFTGDPQTQKSNTTGNKLTENKSSENKLIDKKVTEATHEVVQDYLKDSDVAKVDVNAVFQTHIEKEKARMTRKRKRVQGQLKRTENNENKSRSSKPSDQEIGNFFTDKDETHGTTSLQLRPGSKTSIASIASIASMNPTASEYIFDRSDDTNVLVFEDTMDEFGTEPKLVDLETEDESRLDETMDDKSVFSTASAHSSYGIKPYKQTVPRSNIDNCSLRDIGFDVQHDRTDSSSRNSKTKQKLLYSRHQRRPMSESVLRLAGKPPLPPPHTKVARPHSDTTPRGMRSYSRYMAVDTDLF